MNQSAQLIIDRIAVRRRLLWSLDTAGLYVGVDEETGLCHGRVDKTFALVPVEHAEYIPQAAVNALNRRGLSTYLDGSNLYMLAHVVGEEMVLLDAEEAWVRECGA